MQIITFIYESAVPTAATHTVTSGNEDALALYTLLLAIFTFVLAVSTVALWFTTKKSVAIADMAAKAAAAVELPILLASSIELNQQAIGANEHQWELPTRGCTIIVNYRNYGRTPAIVVETCIEWTLANSLLPQPLYKNAQPAPSGTIVRPDGSERIMVGDYDIIFSGQQRHALNADEMHLWVYGFIRCQDVLGGEYIVGFCERWQRGSERLNSPHSFIDDGPPTYRYRKYSPN